MYFSRLFFAKMEESAHLYFSQTVTRGDNADMKKEEGPSRNLHYLLKGLVLLGLVICIFGVPFSHMLLNLYGGTLLSSGIGPALLRTHCFYILFLAVNGISECYAFNVMTSEEVSKYNYLMTLMTLIFLACTWIFAKLFGPLGFTLANCCNFTMRIVYNFRVIDRRHRGAEVTNPLTGILPNVTTIGTLILSGMICGVSEYHVYDVDLESSFAHLVIGGITFLTAMAVIGFKEPMVKEGLLTLKKKYFP